MSDKTVFIPQELRIGYQKRGDTYTGKLAYVIYVDHKGVLRKETSWESWRDKKIDPDTFDNEPTSGFVLNKRAGGRAGSWGHDVRRETVRVYDPRGFEFEISVPNLLYILENVNSIKGKGLEGEFVYGWEGTDVLLVPVDAPDFQDFITYRDTLYNQTTIKAKDLVLGATYRDTKNRQLVYLGKHDEWDYHYRHTNTPGGWESIDRNKGKKFWFYDRGLTGRSCFMTMSSVSKRLIACIDPSPALDYADLVDEMECQKEYSPIDEGAHRLVPYTREGFHEGFSYRRRFWTGDGLAAEVSHYPQSRDNVYRVEVHTGKYKERTGSWYGSPSYKEEIVNISNLNSLDEVFQTFQPCYRERYLKNGKLYDKEK